jgi:hypothetical protein
LADGHADRRRLPVPLAGALNVIQPSAAVTVQAQLKPVMVELNGGANYPANGYHRC